MSVNPVEANSTIQDGPPPLNYSLKTRIVSNIIFWSSIILTATILPIAIFYPLVYLTSIPIGLILGIAALPNAIPSIFQIPIRIWKLWKQDNGDRRPLSGNILDLFMVEYILSFIVISIVFTVSTSIPIPKLFLMTPSILVGMVCIQFFLSLTRVKSPIWISSLPPGHKIRPAGYYIMEDVVAVDGGGRSAFRRALNVRYELSPIFRRLVLDMTIYWAVGGLLFIGVSAALTFNTSINFAFGATVIWATVWALCWLVPALFWTSYRLRQERDRFREIKNSWTQP